MERSLVLLPINYFNIVSYYCQIMKEKFNQLKYIQNYNKDHYKTFKVDLKKEELEELNQLLKEKSLSKAAFLRSAIEELKKTN